MAHIPFPKEYEPFTGLTSLMKGVGSVKSKTASKTPKRKRWVLAKQRLCKNIDRYSFESEAFNAFSNLWMKGEINDRKPYQIVLEEIE